jgi:enediyne biosynthesis protein E4
METEQVGATPDIGRRAAPIPRARQAARITMALVAVAIAALAASPRDAAGQRADGPGGAAAWFVNIAASAGVTFRHVNGASAERHLHEIMSGGGLFFDYDNDGWLDIFLVDGGSLTDPAVATRARHRLFRNRGNGTFDDVSPRSGLAHRGYGMGACAADYDNDGWIDLYVTSLGANTLYRNAGGASFTDVTQAAGVGSISFAASCAFSDVDRDGDVDLFVVNYVDARLDNNIFCGDAAKRMRIYCHPLNFRPLSNVLYRNNGSGTFADASREAGIGALRGNGLGVVVGDYDDDGWPDIFVANDTTPNFLFHNQGKGVFADVALPAGVSVASDGNPRAGMGTDFGDVDGDGDLDLFVTNHELETHTLFRNLGKGLFSEMTAEAGVGTPTLPFVGFGTAFVDHDNDGDLDLAIVNGHVVNIPALVRPGAKEAQRKLLFVNDGRGRMREIGRQAGPGFAEEKVGRALAAGDIDNDGDVDFLVTNNGADAELLRNDGPAASAGPGATSGTGGNALLLKLVGTAGTPRADASSRLRAADASSQRSNRSAVGARVRVTAGATSGATNRLREVKAGSSYLGQNDLRVHIGLGTATRADRIEVRWPNGASETLTAVAANQIVTITEGRGVTARVPFARRRP